MVPIRLQDVKTIAAVEYVNEGKIQTMFVTNMDCEKEYVYDYIYSAMRSYVVNNISIL